MNLVLLQEEGIIVCWCCVKAPGFILLCSWCVNVCVVPNPRTPIPPHTPCLPPPSLARTSLREEDIIPNRRILYVLRLGVYTSLPPPPIHVVTPQLTNRQL